MYHLCYNTLDDLQYSKQVDDYIVNYIVIKVHLVSR